MSRRTKQASHRRDRRLAKASGWRRQPRRKLGVHAHGETGGVISRLPGRVRRGSLFKKGKRRAGRLKDYQTPPLTESLGNLYGDDS